MLLKADLGMLQPKRSKPQGLHALFGRNKEFIEFLVLYEAAQSTLSHSFFLSLKLTLEEIIWTIDVSYKDTS